MHPREGRGKGPVGMWTGLDLLAASHWMGWETAMEAAKGVVESGEGMVGSFMRRFSPGVAGWPLSLGGGSLGSHQKGKGKGTALGSESGEWARQRHHCEMGAQNGRQGRAS